MTGVHYFKEDNPTVQVYLLLVRNDFF